MQEEEGPLHVLRLGAENRDGIGFGEILVIRLVQSCVKLIGRTLRRNPYLSRMDIPKSTVGGQTDIDPTDKAPTELLTSKWRQDLARLVRHPNVHAANTDLLHQAYTSWKKSGNANNYQRTDTPFVHEIEVTRTGPLRSYGVETAREVGRSAIRCCGALSACARMTRDELTISGGVSRAVPVQEMQSRYPTGIWRLGARIQSKCRTVNAVPRRQIAPFFEEVVLLSFGSRQRIGDYKDGSTRVHRI